MVIFWEGHRSLVFGRTYLNPWHHKHPLVYAVDSRWVWGAATPLGRHAIASKRGLFYRNHWYNCIACRKVISYLHCPDTTVGCARRTHLGNISRKRSGEVPTYDAQPPAVPGSFSGKIVSQFLCLVASPHTHRPSTRVMGVQRLSNTGM